MIEIFGVPYLKKGKGIYIKKKNRGKFTEYCGGEVTDKCIQKAKNSKNPKLRKRATFAANARKWKHQTGGMLSLIPKGQSGWISKLNPLNWFKKDPILKSRKFVENWYNNKTTQQVFNQNYNDYWKPIQLEWSNPELFRQKRDIESNIYLGELHVLPEEYMQDQTNKLNEVNKQIEQALQEEGDISMSNTNNALKTSIDTMHSHAYGYYEDQDFINPKGKDIQEGINVHNSDYARNEHVKGVNGRNITSYRNRDWAKKSAGHEEMHSMHLKESEHAISNILQKYGYDTETYLDCGSEALSRLMNVRLLNKLNPNDRNWTPERVMKLQKNNKGDDRFLNRYSPEAIADIFNLVADNSQNNMNQDNGIHFAKRGNKLRYLYGL